MLVLKLELHSAITGKVTTLGSMLIANDGSGSTSRGNYFGETYRKGNDSWLKLPLFRNRPKAVRKGTVAGYPRKTLPVWCLVKQMLDDMGF